MCAGDRFQAWSVPEYIEWFSSTQEDDCGFLIPQWLIEWNQEETLKYRLSYFLCLPYKGEESVKVSFFVKILGIFDPREDMQNKRVQWNANLVLVK